MLFNTTFVFISVFLFCTSGASADIPPLPESTASMPYIGDYSAALYCLPNGDGNEFYNAQAINNGVYVDATIELIVRDAFEVPIPDVPIEDMWLTFYGGEVFSCDGVLSPDGPTDINGVTNWSVPLRVGGSHSENVWVVVNGETVAFLPLAINSPDMSGDGIVNLADVGLFAEVLFGEYDFSADFYADGELNLADVGLMALGVGTSCP